MEAHRISLLKQSSKNPFFNIVTVDKKVSPAIGTKSATPLAITPSSADTTLRSLSCQKNPEAAKQNVLNRLFDVPGFETSYSANDVSRMAQLYRNHVLISDGGEKRYFEDVDFSLIAGFTTDRIAGPLELVLPDVAKVVKAEVDSYVVDNIGLVYHIGKPYRDLVSDEEDLMQQGVLGLIKAATKYDDSLGNKFSTYACHCIKSHMFASLKERFEGRLASNHLQVYPAYNRLSQMFYAAHGIDISVEEALEKLKGPYLEKQAEKLRNKQKREPNEADIDKWKKKLHQILQDLDYALKIKIVSMNTPSQRRGEEELGDSLGRCDQINDGSEYLELRTKIELIVRSIKDEQKREILFRKFGLGNYSEQSFHEIAMDLGMRVEKVKENYKVGIRILQRSLNRGSNVH